MQRPKILTILFVRTFFALSKIGTLKSSAFGALLYLVGHLKSVMLRPRQIGYFNFEDVNYRWITNSLLVNVFRTFVNVQIVVIPYLKYYAHNFSF